MCRKVLIVLLFITLLLPQPAFAGDLYKVSITLIHVADNGTERPMTNIAVTYVTFEGEFRPISWQYGWTDNVGEVVFLNEKRGFWFDLGLIAPCHEVRGKWTRFVYSPQSVTITLRYQGVCFDREPQKPEKSLWTLHESFNRLDVWIGIWNSEEKQTMLTLIEFSDKENTP